MNAWEVFDKFGGQRIATIPLTNKEGLNQMIVNAQNAELLYREWSSGKKYDTLRRFAKLLENAKNEFIQTIVVEAGKPITYANTEVERAIFTLRSAAEECLRFGGEYIPIDFGIGEGKIAFTQSYPVGIVLGITPFNFPLNLALHKIAPALAVGCPILIKPSPYAPLTVLKLHRLAIEAGFPEGIFQVLICENDVTEEAVRMEEISMLSFTGSPQIGWHLKNICGKKKLCLELGGNAAVLLEYTEDLQKTAHLIASGANSYAGQTCISTQRIYVLDTLWEDFKPAIIEAFSQLKSGDPKDPTTVNGPLIDKVHLQRVQEWVQESLTEGAEVWFGAEVLNENHNLYSPTLLANVPPKAKVYAEEVFGPIAIIEKVNSFEEGIQKINQSRFGLQAGIFTQTLTHIKYALRHLSVGGIIFNQVPGFRIDTMPYGGIKDSGLGREGIRYAMEEMSEKKLIVF